MLFDNENLAPTYQFKAGRPGSSYAFEIAKKSGLPANILKYAKKRTGKNEKAVDELLVDLQREKKELEESLENAKSREKNLEKLIKNYNDLHKDLEYRRKKLKLEVKEAALQETARDNKQLEKIVREIREEQNLEKAKLMAIEARREREQLNTEVSDLREDLYLKPVAKNLQKGELKVGDFVKMKSGGSTGKIESLSKNKAIITMGMLSMTVPLRDLQHAHEPLETKSKSILTDTLDKSANFKDKIDIRGLRMDEALKIVEDFVDQALISSANHLRIVHGKGNGTLRKIVKMKLKEYDSIARIYHPEPQAGGDGVTLVEFG
jgi:DNA mismatch repair protein MutS2